MHLMKANLFCRVSRFFLSVIVVTLSLGFSFRSEVFAQSARDEFPVEENSVNQNNTDSEPLAGKTSVHVECLFRQTAKVSCNDLIRGFFARHQTVAIQEESLERSVLKLSVFDDVGVGSQTQYSFKWQSKNPNDISELVTPPYNVDQSTLDSPLLLENLIGQATLGFSLYLKMKNYKVEEGVLTINFVSKNGTGQAKPDGFFDRLQKSPLYINAGLDGSYRSNGQPPYQTQSMSVNPDLNVIYLQDRYKVDLYVNSKKTMTSVPSSSGGTLSAETNSRFFRGFVVYTRKESRWSVALVEHIGMDNAANTKMFQNVTGGVEWALVPFRTTENKELTFRAGVTQHKLKLYIPNQRGNVTEDYISAFIRLFAYWNSLDARTSLRVFGGYESNLSDEGFERYNIGATMSYQLNRSTKLNLNGYYNYVTKSMTYPGSPDFSNPLMVQQMTGQAGRSLTTSVGIDITIGNRLKQSQDRRWSGETHSHGQ